MRDAYGPGRSRWTTTTGTLMVASALGAIACALVGVSPYPPLTVEVGLAGASAFFAGCWVVASYRARVGPPAPWGALDKPPATVTRPAKPPAPRRPGNLLRYVFAFGVPLATAAALVVAFTVSGEEGRRAERLQRAGWEHHEVSIVRLTGPPDHTPPSDDTDGYYNTDVIVRVPYESGPRDVTLEAAYTREAPEPGMAVDTYYSPGHPELGVGSRPVPEHMGVFVLVMLAIVGGPWFIIGGALIKTQAKPEDLRRLRRFHPATHLPALAILLAGLVLLLPVALEFEVAGLRRLPAFLASLTPGLAVTWVVRRFWDHPRLGA
ncbi:hypothetical protein [Streptomyces sp. NPDC088762]|uniref:hypothetical protein n=1 Tax=Streptomyces sp. NPDC088762 TaxID=3365891 RepID=UPI00381F6714